MLKRPLPIMIAIGLLAGSSLAACGHKGSMVPPADAPSAHAAAASIAAEHCPPSSPQYVLNSGSGLNNSLVPVTAGKLVLCRYNGMNATPGLDLSTGKVITDARSVDTWRQRFNALPTVEPGIYHCPMDDGASILAGFVASATSYTVVKVGLRGCRWATNGSSNRSIAQATDATFLTDLQELVAG